MDSESNIYEVIYCVEDNEYRVYSEICDKLCIESPFKNHLKSITHKNNFHQRHRLINTNN